MQREEYGGYIELERFSGREYHPGAVPLNCGRSAVAYLIASRDIRKVFLPIFLCSSVEDVCRRCGVQVEYYRTGSDFRPVFDRRLTAGEAFFFVNFYGQFAGGEAAGYRERFGGCFIADYSQAFFQEPVAGIDTFYSCRKFFGVPDGAYLYTGCKAEVSVQDVSFERMRFLLGRYEKGAQEFYPEYVRNNKMFRGEGVKMMSKLTHNLLRAVDYERAREARTRNFSYLHRVFEGVNRLGLKVPDGAFMYPLYVPGGRDARRKLIEKKIYIPVLWPEVLERCGKSDIEYSMAADILPLPVDQRYGLGDMEYIAGEVQRCIG